MENRVAVLLPAWQRSRSTLYDYKTEYNGKLIRLEVKKQANIQ
jgi:hypothetical protein